MGKRKKGIVKFEANTLFFVVLISLLIAVLCSSLILYSYISKMQNQKDLVFEKLLINQNSATTLFLSDSSLFNFSEGKNIDLYGDSKDSVFIKSSTWGAFELGLIKSFSGSKSIKRVLLAGYNLKDITHSAIYLKDNEKPLVIMGKCKINGLCYLPSGKVLNGDYGRYVEVPHLINGDIKKSKNDLPSINSQLVESLYKKLDRNIEVEKSIVLPYDTTLFLKASFFDNSILVKSEGVIDLKNKNYSGNVIIHSSKKIILDSTTKLSDVLLFAPVIEVRESFKGKLQMFASDSIIIKKNSTFDCPSVAGILKVGSNESFQPTLILEDGVNFKGIIFSQCKNITDVMKTMITVKKDAIVLGQIFTDGLLNLQGTVFGNVTCNLFCSLNTGFYENYLFDVTIDNSKLPEVFVGTGILNPHGKKKVVLCLEKE